MYCWKQIITSRSWNWTHLQFSTQCSNVSVFSVIFNDFCSVLWVLLYFLRGGAVFSCTQCRLGLYSLGGASSKFIGIGIWKIWRKMCVIINGPGDPDLWPFDLETGMRVASKVGNLPSKFGHARPLGSRIIRYVCDRQMNGRTNAMLIALSLWSGA